MIEPKNGVSPHVAEQIDRWHSSNLELKTHDFLDYLRAENIECLFNISNTEETVSKARAKINYGGKGALVTHTNNVCRDDAESIRLILSSPDPNATITNLYHFMISDFKLNDLRIIFKVQSSEELRHADRLTNKQIFKHLHPFEITRLFDKMNEYGLVDIFREKINNPKKNTMPRDVIDRFRRWDARRAKALTQEPEILTPIEITPPLEEILPKEIKRIGLPVVIVPGLLPEGEHPLDELTEEFRTKAAGPKHDEPQTEPRTKWIEEAILNNPHLNQDRCFVYENPVAVTDKTGVPYKVFHVETIDGNVTQIAVCERKGRVTFAWKNPIDFEEAGASITIQDLREDLTVQGRRCYDPEHFVTNIMDIVFAEPEDLKMQTKTRINWASRGEQLLNSVASFVVEEDRLPTRQDGIIQHGDSMRGSLLRKTTWELADRALRGGPTRSPIPGLEHVKSLAGMGPELIKAYPGLFDEILGEKVMDINPAALTELHAPELPYS